MFQGLPWAQNKPHAWFFSGPLLPWFLLGNLCENPFPLLPVTAFTISHHHHPANLLSSYLEWVSALQPKAWAGHMWTAQEHIWQMLGLGCSVCFRKVCCSLAYDETLKWWKCLWIKKKNEPNNTSRNEFYPIERSPESLEEKHRWRSPKNVGVKKAA